MRPANLIRLGLLATVACAGNTSTPPQATYALVGYLGASGTGPGQFREPMGIAVGAGGELYVADTRNQRIQVLSAGGEFLREWGSPGEHSGGFRLPWVWIATPGRDLGCPAARLC